MITGLGSFSMYVENKSDTTLKVQSIYADFFPTRDDKGSDILASAVTNPSLQTFSKGKSFEEVAKSAREELDARYDEMKKSKKPFDFNSKEGKDWYTLFQNFDRRALYAISSNEGGEFSKEEANIASSIMSQQQGLAMGFPSGPSRLEKNFVDKFAGNDVARFKVSIDFLNSVSTEEKGSRSWSENLTASKNGYEYLKSHGDEKREDDDSLSLIKLLLKVDKKIAEEKAVKRLNTYV